MGRQMKQAPLGGRSQIAPPPHHSPPGDAYDSAPIEVLTKQRTERDGGGEKKREGDVKFCFRRGRVCSPLTSSLSLWDISASLCFSSSSFSSIAFLSNACRDHNQQQQSLSIVHTPSPLSGFTLFPVSLHYQPTSLSLPLSLSLSLSLLLSSSSPLHSLLSNQY